MSVLNNYDNIVIFASQEQHFCLRLASAELETKIDSFKTGFLLNADSVFLDGLPEKP